MKRVPDDTGGLSIISRETGAPAVDLRTLTLPLEVLDVIPEHVARAQEILALRVDDQHIFVATTRPEDRVALDELSFLTGRRVIAYAAHPDQLRATIRDAYEARRRGQAVWRGIKAPHEGDGAGTLEASIRKAAESAPPAVREPFFAETSYRSSTPPRGERVRACILVVEDEPAIRRMEKDALAQRGYEVVDAAGGNEAFRLIKVREPDLILLDAMLPDVHGFDVCKKLKTSARYQHIPIVMVTAVYKGWRMAADLKESYGVTAVIEKPFDLHNLVRVVERALAGRSTDRPDAEKISAEAQRLYREGQAAYRRGDIDGALAALLAAANIDPLSASLRHQLGLAHAQKGQDFMAIQELESAIDIEPHRFQTLRNLAVLYQKHGFRRKACEAWERSIALAPDDATRGEIRKMLLGLI